MSQLESVSEIFNRLRVSDTGTEILKKFDALQLAIIVDQFTDDDTEIRRNIITQVKNVIEIYRKEL
jgi:hypothetical protein